MTRKEQIESVAKQMTGGTTNSPLVSAFFVGAQWADLNPIHEHMSSFATEELVKTNIRMQNEIEELKDLVKAFERACQ